MVKVETVLLFRSVFPHSGSSQWGITTRDSFSLSAADSRRSSRSLFCIVSIFLHIIYLGCPTLTHPGFKLWLTHLLLWGLKHSQTFLFVQTTLMIRQRTERLLAAVESDLWAVCSSLVTIFKYWFRHKHTFGCWHIQFSFWLRYCFEL